MSEKPILFKGDMVRAIMAGQKTQTRRVVKPPWTSARYQVGDLLYVRETWAMVPILDGNTMGYIYRADGEDAFDTIAEGWDFMGKWRPSIHMPKVATRLWLEVTGVRVERVLEISKADCLAEGCVPDPSRFLPQLPGPMYEFLMLWDSINAQRGYGWDKNPWVWVYEFERHNP